MADTPFPQFITDRRRELELTLGDVASDIGVSPITVSNWSNGQSIPEQENLIALASVLDVPAEELAEMAGLTLTPEPTPEAEIVLETVGEEAPVEDKTHDQEVAALPEDADDKEVAALPEAAEVSIPTIEHPALAEAEAKAVAEVEAKKVKTPPAPKVAPKAAPPPKDPEPPPVPDSVPDVIPRVTVSAPTTTQLSPLTYVQDRKQLLRYQIRWGITTVILIIMAFVLVWALGELFSALSDVKESVTP